MMFCLIVGVFFIYFVHSKVEVKYRWERLMNKIELGLKELKGQKISKNEITGLCTLMAADLTMTYFFWGSILYLNINLFHFLLFKVEEAMMVLEDDSPMEAASTPSTPRNLSAWNITIPYIDFYDDDVKRERIPVFCIDVERNDRKAGEA